MNAKIIVFCLITLTITANVGLTQEAPFHKNDFRMSYGKFTVSEVAIGMGEVFTSIGHHIIHDSILSSSITTFGSFAFQYQRSFGKVVQIGGIITFQPIVSKTHYKNGDHTQTDSYNIFSLMPRIDFNYVNRGIFSMYSGFAMGLCMASYSHNYSWQPDVSGVAATVAFQLNVVGFRIGKEIGGFIEFGAGFQGFINLGISARL